MHAVWLRARSELRSRLGAILVLALIAGTLGGGVIAAAAGARRTDTAYPRFLKDKNALDLEIDANAKTKAAAERGLAESPPAAGEPPGGGNGGRPEHVQAARRQHPARGHADAGVRPGPSGVGPGP